VVHSLRLSSAREAASKLGAVWLTDMVQELGGWVSAYERRSASYDAMYGVGLIAELNLRLVIGALPGQAKAALGVGVAQEVLLDQVRLTCLGCRIDQAEAEYLQARLILADLETGTKFVLEHRWKVTTAQLDAMKSNSSNATASLLNTSIAPGVRLEKLAGGQLIARGAKRYANGTLKLARARADQNGLLPQSGDWAKLIAPLRFNSVQALLTDQRERAITAALPRHALPSFVVLTVSTVVSLGYDPAEQMLSAMVLDGDEQPMLVQRRFQSHVRYALDALAAAFSNRFGAVQHIAGEAHWNGSVLVITPWAVVADRVIVPDVEPASTEPTSALAEVEVTDLQLLRGQAHPLHD
jgi:hypothetical protein